MESVSELEQSIPISSSQTAEATAEVTYYQQETFFVVPLAHVVAEVAVLASQINLCLLLPCTPFGSHADQEEKRSQEGNQSTREDQRRNQTGAEAWGTACKAR